MDLAKGEESSNEEDTDSEMAEESDDSDCKSKDKMEHVENANETEAEEESDDIDSSDSEGEEEEEERKVAKYQESSSDSETDKCPVCLNRFLGQDLGSPETCNHVFCLECLLEWCKNINTCPIDRLVFRQICVRHDLGGSIVKKIKIKVPKQNHDRLPSEDTTVCEVCGRGDREDRLLLCDACDLGYHCECLNPPLETVPIEEWYCPPCSSVMSRRSESDRHQPKRRVIARTRISEIVRLRIQLQRTVNSGSSASSSVRPRSIVRHVKRRKYRRRKRKTVKKRATKARTKQSEAGKSAKKPKTKKKVTRKRRKRKVKRKMVQSKRSRLASRPLVAPSVKQRIADRLGLTKPPVGQTIPLLKKQHVPRLRKICGAENVMPSLFLFGEKDQLIKFDESVVKTNSIGSTSSKNSSDVQQGSHSTAGMSLLDAILENQNVLHKSSGNVVIGRDGSLNANTENNLVASRIKKSNMSDKNKTISKSISSNISPESYNMPSLLNNQNILNLNSRTTVSDSGQVYAKNVAHLNDGPKMTSHYRRKGKVAIKEKQVETAKHTAFDQQNIFPTIKSALRTRKFNGKINESSKWNLHNATRKKSDVEKTDERPVTTAEQKKRKPSRESTEYDTLHNASKDRSTAKRKGTNVLKDAKEFSHVNKNIDSKTKFEKIGSETDTSDFNNSYNVPKEKYALNVDKGIKDLIPGEQRQKLSSELAKGSTPFKINSETVYVGKDGIYLKSVPNESSLENNTSNRSCDTTLRISSDKGRVLSTDLSTTNSGLSVTSEIQLPKHNQNTINGQMHSMATENIILQTSNSNKNNITHTNGFTSENEFPNNDTSLHILPENIVVGKDGSIYLKPSDVITCSNTASQNYAEKFVGVAIDNINKPHDSENKTTSNYQNVVAEKFGFSFPSSNNNNGPLNQVSNNHNNFDNCKTLDSHYVFKESISKYSSSSSITSENVILGKDGSIYLKYAELENAVSTTCNESNFTPPACKEKNETENSLKPIMTTAENILNQNVVEHSSNSTSSSLLEYHKDIVNFPVINKDSTLQVGTENSISDNHITSENIVVAEDGSIYQKATDNTDLVNTGSTTYKESHFTALLSKGKNATEEALEPMITATGSSLNQNMVQHNSNISSNLLEHHKEINIPVIVKASTLQIGNESDISDNQMTSKNIAIMKDDPIYLKSTNNNVDLKDTVSTSCKGITFPPSLLNYPNETLENFHVVRKDSLCSVTSTDDSMLKVNNIKLNHPTNNALKLKVKEQFICSETKSKNDQVCLQSPATASILKNNLSVDKDDCTIKSFKIFGGNQLTSEALITSSSNIKTLKKKKRICVNSERLIIGKDGSLCLTSSSPNNSKRRKIHNSMLGTKTFSSMDCETSQETKFSNKLESVSLNNAEMSTAQTTKYSSSYLETNKIVTNSFHDEEGYTNSSSISISDSANSNIMKQPHDPVVSLWHRTPEENDEAKYSVRTDDYNQNYAQEKPLEGQKSSEKSKPCVSSKMGKDSRKHELWKSIIAEVKKALKPFWQQGKITKEQYKGVMHKAVPKIWRNSQNDLDTVKINNLVRSYIVVLESRAKNIKNS